MQLVPLTNTLPTKASGNLADLLAHVTSSYSVLSLKGKKFTKVSGGERKVIPNPKDPESPATSISVLLLGVSKVKPRVFYAKAYDAEQAEGRKPDCMSSDGVKPDANATNPQCKTCAACAHNVWGTKKRQDGSFGKGKACDETVRLAVATPDALNDPMLLRVPPGSLGAIQDLAKTLAGRVSNTYEAVIKISFDPEADVQKLVFTVLGGVPKEYHAEIAEAANSELTKKIVNGDGVDPDIVSHDDDAASGEVEHVEAEAPKRVSAKKQADAAVAKAAALAAAKPTKEVSEAEVVEVIEAAKPAKASKAEVLDIDDLEIEGMDGISFDDPTDD
jgi:hypothetical protein